MASVLDILERSNLETISCLPDLYEVVNGEIVETPPMSFYAGLVANQLNRALSRYLDGNDIGRSGVELLYRIPLPEDQSRNRRPDVGYVSYDRWPRTRPIPATGKALDVVPDIAAEVVSPGDSANEVVAKAREYLGGCVRLVWVVYTLTREIHAYMPGVRDVRIHAESDDLDAGDILPGFRIPVAGLFPPVELPPAPTQAE